MKYASLCYLFVVVLLTMPAAGANADTGSQIPRYLVTKIDVGPLDFISDMNQRGHMVGLGYSEDVPKVFVWDRRRGLEFIEGLVAEEGFIGNTYGINDRDQIVGTRGVGSGGSILRGFIWHRGEGLRLLQPLPGDDHSGAIGINNRGQVIGTSGPYPDEGATGIRGVIWSRHSAQVLDGSPVDINDAGEVAGIVYVQGKAQSYIWDRNNGTRMLGSSAGEVESGASALNDRGEIVGTISVGNGQHAFLWREESGIVDLGDLAGGADLSSANDINNSGQIVGYGAEQSGSQAVIWDSQGVLHNLNDLIVLGEEPDDQFWYMFNARQINDGGWIVVNAFDTRDSTRQWYQLLLTPVRDPAR